MDRAIEPLKHEFSGVSVFLDDIKKIIGIISDLDKKQTWQLRVKSLSLSNLDELEKLELEFDSKNIDEFELKQTGPYNFRFGIDSANKKLSIYILKCDLNCERVFNQIVSLFKKPERNIKIILTAMKAVMTVLTLLTITSMLILIILLLDNRIVSSVSRLIPVIFFLLFFNVRMALGWPNNRLKISYFYLVKRCEHESWLRKISNFVGLPSLPAKIIWFLLGLAASYVFPWIWQTMLIYFPWLKSLGT